MLVATQVRAGGTEVLARMITNGVRPRQVLVPTDGIFDLADTPSIHCDREIRL